MNFFVSKKLLAIYFANLGLNKVTKSKNNEQ